MSDNCDIMRFRQILKLCFLSLFLVPTSLAAQSNMTEGFQYLENGDFEKAKVFFEKIIATDKENKTAQICYNRALGLSGNAYDAIQGFKILEQKHRGDFEIELNLAEAYTWNKQFKNAYELYKELIVQDSTSFPANLGLANSSSEVGDFNTAKKHIKKALSIQPENQNAIISKKYIYLAHAASQRDKGQYGKSKHSLKLLNLEYPNDKDVLLNLSTIALIQDDINGAQTYFEQLLANDLALLEAHLGLSYIYTLKHRSKKALYHAEQAQALDDSIDENNLRAEISYINALGANRKFYKAIEHIDNIQRSYSENPEIDLARARMALWNSDRGISEEILDSLAQIYPESKSIQIAYAEVLHANKKSERAKEHLHKVIADEKNHPGANKLLNKINRDLGKILDVWWMSDSDIAENKSQSIVAKLSLIPIPNHRIHVLAEQRSTTQIGDRDGSQTKFEIGDAWDFTSKLTAIAHFGIVNSEATDLSTSDNIFKTAIQAKLKNLTSEVSLHKEIQNYNTDLILNNLSTTHFSITNNLTLPNNLGFYGQLIRSNISDNNIRNLIFASLYYNLRKFPVIKPGINFLSFEFASKTPRYFSPDYFQNFEGFIQISNIDQLDAKVLFDLFIAIGTQRIEQNDTQGTRRIEAKVGYRFSEKFKIIGSFLNSNSAQTNALGFSYTRFGINSEYIF